MQTYPSCFGSVRPAFRARLVRRVVRRPHARRGSNELVRTGLSALTNLEHRGATGAEADTGDGAGILIQIPDRLLRGGGRLRAAAGRRATPSASPSCPTDEGHREKAQDAIETIVVESGLTVLGWRDVPIRPDCLGKTARAAMPAFRQLFVVVAERARRDRPRPADVRRPQADRARAAGRAADVLLVAVGAHARLQGDVHHAAARRSSTPTSPTRGSRARCCSCTRRFSTNTFPSWPLAHPYRYIAHNGEINTVQGNQNWMRAREAMAASDLLPDLDKAFPICTEGASDTARFDEVLELLHLGRPPAPPRRADDDPGGVGEQRRRWTPTGARSTSSTPA